MPPGEVALPTIVAYEVWIGVLGSQRRRRRRQSRSEQFLATVEVLPFDSVVCRRAAELRYALERRGEGIGPMDTLIAATALSRNATLVTRNLREFGRVQGLEGRRLAQAETKFWWAARRGGSEVLRAYGSSPRRSRRDPQPAAHAASKARSGRMKTAKVEPFARGAFHPDRAAVQLDEALGQCKPEPCAFVL